ncbi:MAG: molybdopterin oxidoreductase family protein [Deltaproteobacteria bacterium]|nr:MAG: molybdopterin oxidoreductase family protein [Deltaproteobacteria bacterium]
MIHHHTCCLCEANCGLLVEHDGEKVLSIRGNPDDVLSQGYICPKATALQDLHEDPDRLRQPMRRDGDSWSPVSWEEAMEEAASRLHQIQEAHGRDAVALYVGNPTVHNYASALALTFFRDVLNTRNAFSATSADQLPHMLAGFLMFGHQLLLPVPDLERTDLLLILGGNPLVSNGSIMTAPNMRRRLKQIQERGGAVVVLDPRKTQTAALADEHHFVRPGSDALVLLALLHTVFAEGRVDEGAWRSFSKGLEQVETLVQAFPPERVAEATGVDAGTLRALALRLCDTPRAAVYGRLGACTQAFGGLNGWLLNVLNIVTGHLDRPGGMMLTQPAVDLPEAASWLGQTGGFARWHSRVRGLPEFGGELPVSVLREEMETPGDGQIRALITHAGNPVLSTPNGEGLSKALEGLDFMVSLDPYITATSRHANLILPPPSPLERDHFALVFHALSVRNVVKYDGPVFANPTLHMDWETLLALGHGLARKRKGVKAIWDSLQLSVMRRFGMRGVLRLLFWGGREGPLRGLFRRRLTLRKVAREPNGIDLGPLQPCLPQRLFHRDKRVDLAPKPYLDDISRLERALEDGEFDRSGSLQLIGRRHLRSNNSWLHNSSRLVKGKPRCTLLMHPDDATERRLSDGQRVFVSSSVGQIEVTLCLSDEMMPGVVSLPHGWGHRDKGAKMQVANATEGASMNDLVDESFLDEMSGNAGLNGLRVQVAPVAPSKQLEQSVTVS